VDNPRRGDGLCFGLRMLARLRAAETEVTGKY